MFRYAPMFRYVSMFRYVPMFKYVPMFRYVPKDIPPSQRFQVPGSDVRLELSDMVKKNFISS